MSRYRFRGGYPLLKKLIKKDPAQAWSMMQAISHSPIVAVNDNYRSNAWKGSDDYEPAQSSFEPLHAEFIHDVKPTINQMLADALRIRVTRKADGKVVKSGWKHRERENDTDLGVDFITRVEGDEQFIGDMVFSTHPSRHRPAGGLMVRYGSTRRGKTLEPQIRATKPRGGSLPERSKLAIESMLALRGVTEIRTYVTGADSLPDMFDPTPASIEAKEVLANAMANTGQMPPITKCPTAIAKGAFFFGGIKKPKPTAVTPVDIWDRMEPDLDTLTAKAKVVVDEVGNRGNYRSLGLRFGYQGGYADRAGKRILLEASDEVARIIPAPANRNVRQPATPDYVPFRAA